uniref:Oberon-like PHD finger domain-containing protein n=1 Tax=Solanum lycopersicum TaxID=4081 RepID=A0A3Q7I4V6_SOLLC
MEDLHDIDFDSDMKERTTSAGTKMQPLLSDSSFRDITCKAGDRICSSLVAENPFTETRFCDLCCSESGFCRDCCCILCSKLINLDYDDYIYCEATVVSGHICGHVSHLKCALQDYMAGRVRGSINLDVEYLCPYCDSRMDLVPHASKLLNICTSIASYDDIEKILNVGIRILRGSQKSIAKELLHHIESINAKV